MTYPKPVTRPFTAEEIVELIERRITSLLDAGSRTRARREVGMGYSLEVIGNERRTLEDLLETIKAGRFPR